jgi:hypothetical protein
MRSEIRCYPGDQMVLQCPGCLNLASHGRDFGNIASLAKAGNFEAYCIRCDQSWKPSSMEQKLIATEAERLLDLPA